MKLYIFTGPTISAADGRGEIDACFLPPVAQGDLYRVALAGPRAIGIIDGYFERMPAVWHKEILWALSQGILVYGSASMGALRAAELARFGMIGVGTIFEAYRDGLLEDDDEVAVAHASANDGYRTTSEPMVNIRATLSRAHTDGVIGDATRLTLERIAKELFYPERVYSTLFEEGANRGLPSGELAALERWIPAGRINRKREDALAMLRVMRADLQSDPAQSPPFSFEHTVFFDRLVNSAGEIASDVNGLAEMISGDELVEELLLDGDLYARALQGALARHLALLEALRQDFTIDDESQEVAIVDFRRFHGVLDGGLDSWLASNQISSSQFRELLREDALVRRLVMYRIGWDVRRRLSDELRLMGEYARVASRASHKQKLLEAHGLQNPSLEQMGVTLDALMNWHAEYSRRSPRDSVQGRIAVARYARENRAGFTSALLREFCYLAIQDEIGDSSAAGQ
jgi:hypothetical protein